jgi:hypothetical protein
VTLNTSGAVIMQQESLWPDLGAYQDVGIAAYFAQVPASFTGSPVFSIQTALVKEEGLFSLSNFALVNVTTTPSNVPGWNFLGNFHMGATNQFCRYLRWSITNGTSTSMNTWQFRLLLNVNPSAS